MSEDYEIIRRGIRRFRIGGIAIAVLPLVLALGTVIAGDNTKALSMLIITIIMLLLVFWLAWCGEDIVRNLENKR